MRSPERWKSFWAAVGLARDDRAMFEAKLHQMSREQLVDLYHMYEEMIADLKGDDFMPYWGEHSEDFIDGAAHDIVAQGEDYYLDVLEHPEFVARKLENVRHDRDDRGTILRVYQKRFGEPLWKQLPRGQNQR